MIFSLFLLLNLLKGAQILLGNSVFATEGSNKIAIYRIPEFRWTNLRLSEVPPASGDLQQPIWSALLPSQVRNLDSIVDFSKPSYGPLATRLVFNVMRDDRIYGLVVPHDGRTPALHVLATAPALSDLERQSTVVTIFIDKIYLEPRNSAGKALMLAFGWPEEADSAQPTGWVPPVLHFTHRKYHTSANHFYDLVDEVSGRVVVTGSKFDNIDLPEGADGVDDDICSSVVDFCHPQFLPSSFNS